MRAVHVLLVSYLVLVATSVGCEKTRANNTQEVKVTTAVLGITEENSQNKTQKVDEDSGGDTGTFEINTTQQNPTTLDDSPEGEEKNTKHDIDNLFLTEEPEYATISPNDIHDPKKFERRADDGYFGDQDMQESSIRITSPNVDPEMAKRAFQEEKDNKIRSILSTEDNRDTVQRRTFDIMGMLGLKSDEKNMDIIKIIKEVSVPVPYPEEKKIPVPVKFEVERRIPVEVPKPYPVRVEKKVFYPVKEYISAPYPVYKKVPYLVKVSVEQPVPVHITKPYPVFIEKKVMYPVEKQIPYPVKIPVDRPIPVHVPVLKNIYYPVEKKINYPVPVHVEKPVPVPVEKPYPVYIEKKVPVVVEKNVPYAVPIEEHKTENHFESSPLSTGHSYEPTEHHQSLHDVGYQSFDNTGSSKENGGFVPINVHQSIEARDDKTPQKKKDEEYLTILETTAEVTKSLNRTETTLSPPKAEVTIKVGEKTKGKNKEGKEEFGRRLKKL